MLFTTALLIGDSEYLERVSCRRYDCFNGYSKYTFAHQEIRLSGKQVIYGSQNDVPLSLSF
jgi:hypothetical protein